MVYPCVSALSVTSDGDGITCLCRSAFEATHTYPGLSVQPVMRGSFRIANLRSHEDFLMRPQRRKGHLAGGWIQTGNLRCSCTRMIRQSTSPSILTVDLSLSYTRMVARLSGPSSVCSVSALSPRPSRRGLLSGRQASVPLCHR